MIQDVKHVDKNKVALITSNNDECYITIEKELIDQYIPQELCETGRDDILNWNDYFMELANISSKRSKDPEQQVGAVIVDINNRIISIGYNGFPNNCDESRLPWNSEANPRYELLKKNFFVVHAELNAILNSGRNINNSSIYTTLYPCNECAKAIIQAGIKKVYYKEKRNGIKYIASDILFNLANVETIQL